MTGRFLRRAPGGCMGALLLALAACGDSTGPGGMTVSGSFTSSIAMPASGTVGSAAGASPTVLLKDRRGQPLAGQQVSFEVTAGGGTVARTSVATDAAGLASAGAWILGTVPGPNTVVARTENFPAVTFQVTAVPDRPALVTAATATLTTGIRSQALMPAPSVRLLDRFGNPVPGATVEFAVSGGGGTVTGSPALSGTDGVARVGSWTLGPAAGINVLRAAHGDLAAVTFTVTATTGPASVVERAAGDGQSVAPGSTVPVRPTVRVTDAVGNPVAGSTVSFAVASGGGSATGTTQLTDAGGYASVGSWTVGAAEGTNTLTATVSGVGSATFTALASTGVPTSPFRIEVRFIGPVATAYQQAFQNAATRWQNIIVGDLPAISLNYPAGGCDPAMPAINETVDDVIIYVQLKEIDGDYGVLGRAGPCYVRASSFLPAAGFMQFDTADLARLLDSGLLNATVLHEIGHVLGIGTVWERPAQFPVLLFGIDGNDPYFGGSAARQYFTQAGGTHPNGVPVEADGGEGTALAHWREGSLQAELMTGWISNGANPLSAITIGSLADLGYTVNYLAADAFTVPAAGTLSGLVERGEELIELRMPAPVVVR